MDLDLSTHAVWIVNIALQTWEAMVMQWLAHLPVHSKVMYLNPLILEIFIKMVMGSQVIPT